MSFIEFCLYWYQKVPKDFVDGYKKPRGTPEYLSALDACSAVQKRRDEIAAKHAQLAAVAASGGVKGNAAKAELEQLKQVPDMELSKLEIKAQTALKKAIKNNVDPMVEEEKRVAAEKAAKDEADRVTKEASRAKLAAKTAAFGGQ